MDEPDQLKDLRAAEQINLSYGHVLLEGLDQARRHQRGEKVGKAGRQPRKQPKRTFTPEQITDMSTSTEPLAVVAKRVGTSKETVRGFRNSWKAP